MKLTTTKAPVLIAEEFTCKGRSQVIKVRHYILLLEFNVQKDEKEPY